MSKNSVMKEPMKVYRKNFKINWIKQDKTYSINDIVERLGVHKRTVSRWIKEDGLQLIDNHKPYLILGSNLKAFLKKRQQNRKHPCRQDEFYCMKCRCARRSWENLVDIKLLNEKQLQIEGICSVCETSVKKFDTVKRFPIIEKNYVIQKIHNKDLIESSNTRLYVHFKRYE